MRFSLVLATIGRTTELKRFLESLNQQTYKDFELFIIDQNPDDRLIDIIKLYKECFPICHLRSEPGLSRARNIGLQHITGDIVAFPDDDCWYPSDLLERVACFFAESSNWDGITGKTVNEQGNDVVGRFDRKSGLVTRMNAWRRVTSITLFVSKTIVKTVGNFDESLGLGAGTQWCSAEDIDYPLRAIELGFRIYYDPTLNVGHPEPVVIFNEKAQKRAFSYGAGMGRVLRKHRYPFWFVVYNWLRPLGGSLVSLVTGRKQKAKYHWAVMKGRLYGWWTGLI